MSVKQTESKITALFFMSGYPATMTMPGIAIPS